MTSLDPCPLLVQHIIILMLFCNTQAGKILRTFAISFRRNRKVIKIIIIICLVSIFLVIFMDK